MRSTLLFAVLFFATAVYGYSQEQETKSTNPELGAGTQAKVKTAPVKTGPDVSNSSADAAKQTTYVRPDSKKRVKSYVNSVVGPFVLARQAAGAGISTWRNSPEEWGDKWEGFGRRFASNFGRNAIKQTTIFSLDETLKVDSGFYRSKNKGVSARLRNAIISPVTARDARGKRVFGLPRIAGTYASSIIAYETWYPKRYNYKDGLRSGTISLGLNAAFNLFKEFIWKK